MSALEPLKSRVLGNAERNAIQAPELLKLRNDAVGHTRDACDMCEALSFAQQKPCLKQTQTLRERSTQRAKRERSYRNMKERWRTLGEQALHHGLHHFQLVLNRKVDEVRVDEHMVRRTKLGVVLEEKGRRHRGPAPSCEIRELNVRYSPPHKRRSRRHDDHHHLHHHHHHHHHHLHHHHHHHHHNQKSKFKNLKSKIENQKIEK